ncbi:MAG: class I SAM-dependent methyltransferase [Fermentimonas sp.]|jgi:phosphatidylethanolamine/phosphatidyl-N-methylethanolamine N-methyltransferase
MNNNTRFWDRVAGIYDIFVNVINAKTHRRLCDEITRLIEPTDIVLECACGTGMLTKVIAPQCTKLIATDFSTKMLQRTKKKCKNFTNIDFRTDDITSLDFETDSFDKVVAGNVIHLLQYPRKALREMERVCRPGGKLIVPTYIVTSKQEKITRIYGKMGAGFKNKFTSASYEQFFIDSGYINVEFINAEGKIPCSIAVIEKKEKNDNETCKYAVVCRV